MLVRVKVIRRVVWCRYRYPKSFPGKNQLLQIPLDAALISADENPSIRDWSLWLSIAWGCMSIFGSAGDLSSIPSFRITGSANSNLSYLGSSFLSPMPI
jgi:hypothetical protein